MKFNRTANWSRQDAQRARFVETVNSKINEAEVAALSEALVLVVGGGEELGMVICPSHLSSRPPPSMPEPMVWMSVAGR